MTYKSIIGNGQSGFDTVTVSAVAAGTIGFGTVGGIACLAGMASSDNGANMYTEAAAQLTCHCAHIASNMTVRRTSTNATTVAVKLYFRNNAVDSQSHINLPTGTTANAVMTDTGDTDTVLEGSTLSSAVSYPASGTGFDIFAGTMWEADQALGCVIPYATFLNSYNTFQGVNTTAARYMGLTGDTHINATQSASQCPMVFGGTAAKLTCNIHSNALTTQKVFSFQKGSTQGGGVSGNQFINLLSLVPGVYEDTGDTDSVLSGQLINYATGATGSGLIAFSAMGVTFTNSPANSFTMTSAGLPANSAATVQYWNFMNAPRGSNSNLECPYPAPVGCTMSGLVVSLTTAAAAAVPMQSWVRGAAGQQSATSSAGGGAQVVSDTGDSDTLLVGDLFAATSNYGGAATYIVAGMAMGFTTPAPGGAHPDQMSLMGVG